MWVVDNDAEGRAGVAVGEALAAGYPWPLHHVVAPERGISHARNRALEAALPGCDYLAFIDDDETAPRDWLRELPSALRFVPAYLSREGLRALALMLARLRGRRRHVGLDLIYCGAIQLGTVSAILGGRPRHYRRTQGG